MVVLDLSSPLHYTTSNIQLVYSCIQNCYKFSPYTYSYTYMYTLLNICLPVTYGISKKTSVWNGHTTLICKTLCWLSRDFTGILHFMMYQLYINMMCRSQFMISKKNLSIIKKWYYILAIQWNTIWMSYESTLYFTFRG